MTGRYEPIPMRKPEDIKLRVDTGVLPIFDENIVEAAPEIGYSPFNSIPERAFQALEEYWNHVQRLAGRAVHALGPLDQRELDRCLCDRELPSAYNFHYNDKIRCNCGRVWIAHGRRYDVTQNKWRCRHTRWIVRSRRAY